MRYYLIIGAVLFSAVTTDLLAQVQNNIKDLEQIIFPVNSPTEKSILLEEFTIAKETYQIYGRKNQPQSKDLTIFYDILKTIRTSRDTSYIELLLPIQRKHEKLFVQEWEKAWIKGHYMYDLQYEILMALELTLLSLHLQQIDSEQKRYDLLKDLYYLQWVVTKEEAKKELVQQIDFHSNYLKNKWYGACISTSFCTPSLIVESANQLSSGIINDLSTFSLKNLTERERNFYAITLAKAVVNISSDQIEETYSERIDTLDMILIKDTTLYDNYRSPWIYYTLGKRGRTKGIELLLNEMNNYQLVHLPSFLIEKLVYTENGKKILHEKYLDSLKKVSSQMEDKLLKRFMLLHKKYLDTEIDIDFFSERLSSKNILKLNQYLKTGIIN